MSTSAREMTAVEMDRRGFFRVGAGAAALAAGAPLLAACGGSDDEGSGGPTGATPETSSASSSTGGGPTGPDASSPGSGSSATPAYVPFEKVTPDLPATADGVMPGFFTYPSPLVKTVPTPPLSGGEVSIMSNLQTLMVPEHENKVWQQMNADTGTHLKINTVISSEYQAKLQTVIASGDLPDITVLRGVPDLPKVLESLFADLSDILGGDGAKDYPNLANIPSSIWKACMYNGKLYTLPDFRGVVGNLMLLRPDVLSAKGLPTTISSGADFRSLCTELTDAKATKYAIAQSPMIILPFIQEMTGAPNGWAVEDGKFSSAWAAPQTRQAVDILAQMWQKDRVFNPDVFSGTINQQTLFTSGESPLQYGSYAVWPFQLRQGAQIKGFEVGAFVPPHWSGGGKAAKHLRTTPIAISAIKKDKPERVKEILQVVNYLAAPYGSTERLLIGYGIEGRDYTMDGHDPIPTEHHDETHLSTQYVVSCPPALYSPGQPDATKQQYNIQKETVPTGIEDPSTGLVSNTMLSKGPSINKKLTDAIGDVIQGRKKLADFDSAVKSWRSAGGDQAAAEFAASYAQAH